MKYLFFSLAIVFAFITSNVYSSQYVGAHLGSDFLHFTNTKVNSQKVGIKTGATYGFVFDSGIRAEIEVAYRHNPFNSKTITLPNGRTTSTTSRKITSWAYMANIFYDVAQLNFYTLTPYFGIGLGFSTQKHVVTNKIGNDYVQYRFENQAPTKKPTYKTSNNKNNNNIFVYQGIIGLKYPLNPTMTVAGEYHYLSGHSHQKNHSFEMKIAKHF